MSRQPYRVGIIGYGLSAKIFHIPYVSMVPEFKLQAICQRHVSPTNDASKDYPDIDVFKSPEELIQSPKVDLVIICTPPTTHLALAKQSLEAQKHVVVEKPFCPTSEECRELIECSKRNNRLLTVFQNRRWDADFQTVLELLRNKTLGRVVEFESHFDRWSPNVATNWKSENIPGQGVVYDLGSHLIDQIVVAFGMPKKVTGFVQQQKKQAAAGLEDACTILLHYEEMVATVKCTALSAAVNQLRFWIKGDNGSFKKFHLDPQEPQLKGGMKTDDPDFGKESSDRYGILSKVTGGSIVEEQYATVKPPTYKAFFQELAKALDTGAPAPVDPADALGVIYLIELTRESARCGQTLEVKV